MHRILRALMLAALVIVAGFSTGCGASINVYDGPERPDTEVAIVRGGALTNGHGSSIVGVDDQRYVLSIPDEVKLLPGEHTINVRCTKPGATSDTYFFTNGVVTSVLEANVTYKVMCDNFTGSAQLIIDPGYKDTWK